MAREDFEWVEGDRWYSRSVEVRSRGLKTSRREEKRTSSVPLEFWSSAGRHRVWSRAHWLVAKHSCRKMDVTRKKLR